MRRYAAWGAALLAALTAALAVLEDVPDDAKALFIAGVCHQEKGQIDASLPPLGRAVELMPDYAPAHLRLGVSLQQSGQLDEALAA